MITTNVPFQFNHFTVYALGFLWADGHLFRSRNSYYISFRVKDQDFNEIFSAVKCLKDEKEWVVYRVKEYGSVRKSGEVTTNKAINQANLYDGNIGEFLKKYDFLEKSYKSPSSLLSIIPEGLKRFFWKGYFDGDGCIYISKKGVPNLSISSSYNQDWDSVRKLFDNLGIKKGLIGQRIYKSGSCGSSATIRNLIEVNKFCEYIFGGTEIIGLKRKMNKWIFLKDKIEKYIDKIENLGVAYHNKSKKWKSSITHAGKKYYLGSFDEKEEAIKIVKLNKEIILSLNADQTFDPIINLKIIIFKNQKFVSFRHLGQFLGITEKCAFWRANYAKKNKIDIIYNRENIKYSYYNSNV